MFIYGNAAAQELIYFRLTLQKVITWIQFNTQLVNILAGK